MCGFLLLFITSNGISLIQVIVGIQDEERRELLFEMNVLVQGMLHIFCLFVAPSFLWLVTFQIISLATCIASGILCAQVGY